MKCSAVGTKNQAQYICTVEPGAYLASVLSTNNRRGPSCLLCSDWFNRCLTVHAGYIVVHAGYILVHAGYIVVHAGYIPVHAGYMSNCHL